MKTVKGILLNKVKGFLVVLALGTVLFSCQSPGSDDGDSATKKGQKKALSEPQVDKDLPEILSKDTLNAITIFSSTSYFIYRGQQMGFEYELLQRLSDQLDLELNMILARDLDTVFKMLNTGKGDLVAYGLTVTNERKERVDFTVPHNKVRQVLVQQKPDNWRHLRTHHLNDKMLRSPMELDGDTVYVRKNSAYYDRLKNLEEEIGGNIHIIEAESDVTTEDLIRRVSMGEIEYTVSDENIAQVNETQHPNIDIKTPLSFPQKISWAVRKNSPKLKDTLNHWINTMKGSTVYNVIYNKYFESRDATQKRRRSAFFTLSTNKISEYDPLFKKYSDNLPKAYDWLLLASLSFQESRFNPKTKSWAGAKGLMQLMPMTAADYNVGNLYRPESSVKAGTKHLAWLDKEIWRDKIENVRERRKFVLASYNAGAGHVADAMRLTEKYGGDPTKWRNVSEYLLKKSKPKFYNDDVVKYGYCRGREPYNYVNEIMNRYKHYKQFLDQLKNKGGKDIPDQQAFLVK